jgi:hypothetical protein
MLTPRVHFRRKYELLSFSLEIVTFLALCATLLVQQFRISNYAQELESLRTDVGTIKAKLLLQQNVSAPPPKPVPGSNTATPLSEQPTPSK